jgi:8-oxo-dGTP pyrophosphatase MutT (NUDIX family)
MPLVQRDAGLHVLFTRRAAHLHHHAGQISFPGGRIEPSDSGPVAAALRETREEIGVDRHFVQVIGTQPTLLTTTHFLMTPVIGELLPGFRVRPDESEVAEVFEVPLAVLMDPARHVLHQLETSHGHGRCYFAIPWESRFIWGATAILIRNFYHFLAASQGIAIPGIGAQEAGRTQP